MIFSSDAITTTRILIVFTYQLVLYGAHFYHYILTIITVILSGLLGLQVRHLRFKVWGFRVVSTLRFEA